VSAEQLRGPEPLTARHEVNRFRCGVRTLDDYLARQALSDQRAEKTRTYVVCRGRRVVGYFSLAAGGVEPEAATGRLAAGQGRQTIPVILLARLAIHDAEQQQGLGEALLVEALTRSAAAADTIGARAVIVHAVGPRARAFYERYGFEPSPTNPLHIVLLMKDIRRSLGGGN
jgi:GNAT superfamily N-acetyltransferase